MPSSVLEAIKMGMWDYEPQTAQTSYDSTGALPGTSEKLEVMAKRVQAGLPLWHPEDRRTYEDLEIDS